eukprot:UN25808
MNNGENTLPPAFCDLLKSIFGAEVSLNDSCTFQELGGTSVNVIRLITTLRDKHSITLKPKDIYNLTIKELGDICINPLLKEMIIGQKLTDWKKEYSLHKEYGPIEDVKTIKNLNVMIF